MSDHEPVPEERPTVGHLVERLAEQITRLIRFEIALARIEARSAIAPYAVGVGFLLFAALILPYLLAVLIFFGIALFATGGSLWAAAGWVALILVGLMAILGGAGLLVIKRQKEQALFAKTKKHLTDDITTLQEGFRP